MFKSAFVILSLFLSNSWGHSWGAPASVCQSMTPKHPGSPQSGNLPVKIAVIPQVVKGGEVVEIEISGKEFKGIFVQVRNSENEASGSFELTKDNKTILKTIDCNANDDSAVTHKSSKPKSKITLKWRAPKSPGEYKIAVTIVESKLTYWVGKNVETIQVI